MCHRNVISISVVSLVVGGLLGLFVLGCEKTSKPDSDESATNEAGIEYVNSRCPIMGMAIVPAKVTGAMTRQYKGQNIAFCCGNCPAVWDNLPDDEKQAKLQTVLIGHAEGPEVTVH